jgi:hypothetical protein
MTATLIKPTLIAAAKAKFSLPDTFIVPGFRPALADSSV